MWGRKCISKSEPHQHEVLEQELKQGKARLHTRVEGQIGNSVA